MRWILGFGAWTAFALLSAIHGFLLFDRLGSTLPRGELITHRMLDWYTCAIFTPFFFWMVRRWPLVRGRIAQSALVYGIGIALATVAKYVIYVPLGQWLTPAFAERSLKEAILRNGIPECMAFAALLGVVLAVEYARVVRERDAREARLAGELATAQLDALTAQLQPHFLFNTLHGVTALMRRDPDAAETMLVRLGDLLRKTLDRGDTPEIPLQAELALLQLYVDIQQVRFGERLRVTVEADPVLRDALVPRFLLQPLVENALQHGIGSRAGRGRVLVLVQERTDGAGSVLELSVTDDGPGLDNGRLSEGVGLGNTRRRLAVLYGDTADLELLRDGDRTGVTARVTLPLRRAGIPR